MTDRYKNMSCEEILDEFRNHCSRSCKKDGECIKFVQLYIDNMACKNKDAYFLEGIKNCSACVEYFQINDCIKNNLKNKYSELPVSEDFVEKVKNSLQNENYYTRTK